MATVSCRAACEEVPLIFDVDLLVVGGGLAGLATARAAAENGWSVALVESYTFLGHELAAWQRPWVGWREEHGGLLREWLPLDESAAPGEGEIIPLPMDDLKRGLEDRLLSVGVKLLYASRPVAWRQHGDGWLVVIGNKSGRQAVTARYIVDASEGGIMRLLAGHQRTDCRPHAPRRMSVRRALEFTEVPRQGVTACEIPASLRIAGDQVTIYPGAFSADHVYVDIPVPVETPRGPSVWADCEIELAARTRSLEVAEHLVHHKPAFAKAKLGLGSLQVMCEQEWEAAGLLRRGGDFAGKMLTGECPPGCYMLNAAGGERIELTQEKTLTAAGPPAALYRDQTDFSVHWAGDKVPAPIGDLEILAQVDVAVIGGGTSGATAARVAAANGASTALVEMNAALGGTGTVGSIRAYWMTTPDALKSLPNSFSDELDRRVAVWEVRVGYPRTPYTWVRRDREGRASWWGEDRMWSIEVKAHVLLEMCREAGVHVCLNSFCIGTLVEDSKVVGMVVATPYGPRAILSKVTIDATGDGDVAAFAGAEHVYGSERDRYAMWACLAFYRQPGELGSHFTSTVDVSDVFDYTRFILANRRRGGKLHDHGTYIAPRESRHIRGETVVTLEDELLLACHPDTVAVFFSNYDMKGGHVADLVDFGIIPPNSDIEVPYRALVPRGLDGILVAGKAFSLTHDAAAAPRMQRDLQLLGGVTGLAAALAVAEGVSVKALDIARLQRLLVDSGNLPARILAPHPAALPPSLQEVIDSLTGDDRFEWLEMLSTDRATSIAPVIRLCCADRAEAMPLLQAAFAGSHGRRRLLLARLLLWHGCPDGVAEVMTEVDRLLAATDGLPPCTRDLWWISGVPEHGVMPEVVYLLHALARVRHPSVVRVFAEIVDRVERSPRDYGDARARVYDYLRAVAVAAERLTMPEFIPLLQRLLALPELRASVQPRFVDLDHLDERKAHLVLSLARALARCGRVDGLLQLAELLSDNRAAIARSAHQELTAITGLPFPFGGDDWRKTFREWPLEFAPVPWDRPLR